MIDLAHLGLNQSLWVAFHDSIFEDLHLEEDSLKIQLRTNFPHPPEESAKRACLQFHQLRSLRISSLGGSMPVGAEIPLERLLLAMADDSLDITDAAWNPGSPIRLGIEAWFWNDELGAVLIDITAERLEVLADDRPSSMDEWLGWGGAGWDQFSKREPQT